MAHLLRLGFVDNPTIGSDDAIDLAASSGTSGYFLKDLNLGTGTLKVDTYYNRIVRTITIQLEVRGTSQDDLYSKKRAIDRYIEQTEAYFKPFGGNIPARSDGLWHKYDAAVLTMQANSASNLVYWNVLGGATASSGILADVNTAAFILPVTVSLTCEGMARGDRVLLDNLVACGDFAPPFSVSTTAFQGGWSFTGSWSQGTDSTNRYYYYISAGASCTATSYAADNTYVELGNILLPRISLYVAAKPSSGTLSCVMEVWNGASWGTQQTLFSITSGSNISLNTWLHYPGTAYTVSGVTKARLSINTGSASTSVRIAGAAIWRNPVNNAEPTEFIAGGRSVGVPYLNLYNAQGDAPVPLTMHVNMGGSTGGKIWHIGHGYFNPLVDKPLFTMDFKTSNGAAATTNFWGSLGATSSGAATSSNYLIQNSAPGYNRAVDHRPRKYMAYLSYAANDKAVISAISVRPKFGPGYEIKTYNKSLPQTYTGNTVPVEANYRLYRLGEFLHGRPGVPYIEDAPALDSASVIVATHSNDANRNMGITGVLLVPAEEFMTVDTNATGTAVVVSLFCEGTAPRVGISSTSLGSTGTLSSFVDLTSWDTGALATGGPLTVTPNQTSTLYTVDRYEILMAASKDSSDNNLLTYDATVYRSAWIEYTPRYLEVR